METKKLFTFWRMQSHYVQVAYSLDEIQEMMTGHIVDSELFGDHRLSDATLAQRFVDQVNSWADASLSRELAVDAVVDDVVSESTAWQWDTEA